LRYAQLNPFLSLLFDTIWTLTRRKRKRKRSRCGFCNKYLAADEFFGGDSCVGCLIHFKKLTIQ